MNWESFFGKMSTWLQIASIYCRDLFVSLVVRIALSDYMILNLDDALGLIDYLTCCWLYSLL